MNLGRIRAKLYGVELKFILFSFCVGLISFAVAAVYSNVWTVQELEKKYWEKAELIWKHVISDLEEGMIFKNHNWIINTLNDYRDEAEILELRVFDLKGQEFFAREKGSSDPRIEESLRTGNTDHFEREIGGKQAASYVIPMKNKPECRGCHSDGQQLRGALLISFSLAGLTKEIAQQRKRFFLLFALIALVITLATLFAANRFFVRPLMSIQKGTEIIEKGNFQYRIPIESRDEIGDLAGKFNHMAQTLQTFLREIENKNRQMTDQVRLVSLSQKEWQETFDNITDPIAVIGKGSVVLRANRAFTEHFSQGLLESIKGLTGPLCHRISHEDRTPNTFELPGADTGKVLEVSLFPYYSPENECVGSILVASDVTEKKTSEMRLIMSERLAALGQMASGIAHEINNPLATISVCTEGLLNKVSEGKIDPHRFKNYLEVIGEELGRCQHITTSMLSFVRKKSNGNQTAVLNDVLDRTLEMIDFQGRLDGIKILKNHRDGRIDVRGNEGDLRQVFLSIIVNALDAMEDRGRLEVETNIDGDKAFVRITDTGPGIPPSELGRIFDPFFTTKSDKGGTGLGLSIADKIIKENDGKIEVTSVEGEGTTFKITLLLSSSDTVKESPQAAT